MEEVIAKTKRGLYIGTYVVFIILGIIFAAVGFLMINSIDEEEAIACGWIIAVLGIVLIIGAICWLIYFIRMPKVAISYKDGKLYFMNGVVCTPTEVESWQVKSGGLDGALFNFGHIILVINSVKFKLKYVDNISNVLSRLYTLKAEHQMKAEIAKRNAAQAQSKATEPINTVENSEENNG